MVPPGHRVAMALAVRLRGLLGLGGRACSSSPAPASGPPPPRLQYRRHPGVTRLGAVRLPDPLRRAALLLLHGQSV